jgi:large repetitive protein
MIKKSVPSNAPRITVPLTCVMYLLLLLLLYLWMLNGARCLDGCGPYHNPTSVADLDGDGHLDVVLANLRHETDTIFWAGPTLWFNQSGGKFTPRRVDMGGPSTATGDLDGDGDADIVQMDYTASIFLNQGGAQGGQTGTFKRWRSIALHENQHNWSTPGNVVLGDLDNDGRLDALVTYCCSNLFYPQPVDLSPSPFLPFVWINAVDENGFLVGRSFNLTSVGDLPMRPALGDLDGDGDLDIFAAIQPPRFGRYGSGYRVLLNDGSGNFLDSGQRLAEAGPVRKNPGEILVFVQRLLLPAFGNAATQAPGIPVALGDLDGDGDLDALAAKSYGALIWTNQGGAQGGQAGIFKPSQQRIYGRGSTEAVFLADLDADGDLDALVATKSQAVIWWNDGQAGFTSSRQRLRFTERHGLALGDFDGNGSIDVIAAAYDADYRLWINQGDGRLLNGKRVLTYKDPPS